MDRREMMMALHRAILRGLRRASPYLAVVALAAILLLVLFYLEENARGARAWAACQQELAAKGESLDLRVLAPPGKPEADLTKAPIFAEYLAKDGMLNSRLARLRLELDLKNSGLTPKVGNYLHRQPTDLEAWQKFYRSIPESGLKEPAVAGARRPPGPTNVPTSPTGARRAPATQTPAQDVLHVLSRYDDTMTAVDQAVSREGAFWPINYERPFVTPLSGVTVAIGISQILRLRGAAHLGDDDPARAEQDYLASFRLNRPQMRNGFLVSYLVAIGVRAIDNSILWEGLHRHAWSDAQLREMETALTDEDFLGAFPYFLRRERAFGLKTLDFVQHNPRYTYLAAANDSKDDFTAWLNGPFVLISRPSGWWDFDRASQASKLQVLTDAFNPQEGWIDRDAFTVDKTKQKGWVKSAFTKVMLEPFTTMGIKVAHAEINQRLARLACRLEEFRIAHGKYPERLDELPDLPAHLNQEIVSTDPLKYRAEGDGYLLYSNGWDGKDDGGTPSKPGEEDKGDWVWPSP